MSDALLVLMPFTTLGVAVVLLLAAALHTRLGPDYRAFVDRWTGPLSVFGVGVPFLLALVGVFSDGGSGPRVEALWFSVGDLDVFFGLRLDGLATVMAVVVAGVSVLVQLFSIGYMKGEHGYVLYFAELSLFSAAMLLLVLASNFFLLFMAWELVGATSYLLISFYYHRPAAASAGKKAFLTTRLGDLGFLIAIFAIFFHLGTLRFDEVFAAAEAGMLGAGWEVAVPLLIFAGAVGKSAQLPLSVWLPDAMEGPTPVSALIHAATMVAAGVYLVARTFPLFELAPAALTVVAWVGALTALVAATIAVSQRDIKRVLAYSTISQLGFMVTALGAGVPEAGMFHLFTHAWFKALLFLGAGSVIHASGLHAVSIDDVGGLVKRMPITAWTFVLAGLALAGIPPFAGFWSKEEIFSGLLAEEPVLLGILLVASFLTAFYIFRLIFLVFFGPERFAHGEVSRFHESPTVMGIPLLVLGAMSVLAGFAGVSFLGFPLQGLMDLEPAAEEGHVTLWLLALASGLGVAGIALAWWQYGGDRPLEADVALRRNLGPLYQVSENAYYLDPIYNRTLIGPFLSAAGFLAFSIDNGLIDGAVNGLARLTQGLGALFRRAQTGLVRDYVTGMAVGSIILAAVLWRVL